jgi:pyruvate/2-oxoacid:ferredoxin oxidoreductase beta subunit
MGGIFPQTGLNLPLTHCNFGAAAAFASGIRAALNDKKEKKIQVLVWAGDGATYDIGFGALSAAAEREEDILYLCANNEAYMNTGIQRSSATPFLAWTTTTPLPQLKLQPKKPLVEIMAAHKIPYSASASIGFKKDLERKLKIAKKIKGFKFIDLLVPCPTGWRARSDLTIKLSRMAVNCGIFPLIEIFDGKKYRINYPQGELLPVKDYLSLQGRFSHLEQSQILEIEKMIKENLDWLKKLQNLNP